MAKKKNTITPFIRELHASLAKCNFTAFAADSASKRDIERIRKQVQNGNLRSLITMAALLGWDVYEEDTQASGCVAFGANMIRGEEVIPLIAESISAVQANSVENGYEAMESFVKNAAGEYLYGMRGRVPINQKWRQQQQKMYGNKAAQEGTKPYYCQIARVLARRNCEPILKVFFKHVTNLRTRLASSPFGNLYDIHLAVETFRHCSTHSNGKYIAAEFNKMPELTQSILKKLARRSIVHGDLRLLPTFEEARDLLAREAEFAQLLYDSVTTELGMTLDYKPS